MIEFLRQYAVLIVLAAIIGAIIFGVWLDERKPYTPKTANVGKSSVLVSFLMLDGSTTDYARLFVGESDDWGGTFGLSTHTAKSKAKEFIKDSAPIHVGDGVYVPRNRVLLYDAVHVDYIIEATRRR